MCWRAVSSSLDLGSRALKEVRPCDARSWGFSRTQAIAARSSMALDENFPSDLHLLPGHPTSGSGVLKSVYLNGSLEAGRWPCNVLDF